MVGRDGAFGVLIGAAVGTCCLVLACGSPQDAQSASCEDPQDYATPLEDLIRCTDQGYARAQDELAARYVRGEGVPQDDAEAVRLARLAAEQAGYRANAFASVWDREPWRRSARDNNAGSD